MARHEITIPINKSSNDNKKIYIAPGEHMYPPFTSSTLYLSNIHDASNKYINNIGLGWDKSLIPSNKIIVEVKLYIYAKYSYYSSFGYRNIQFNEGMSIPSINPTDGAFTNKFSSGWNEISLLNYEGDSIVIGNTISQPYNSSATYGQFYSHRASINKPYVVVTYDDVPPGNPKSLYPSNIILNPRESIKFSWLHDSKEGLQQKGFTLQYSTNSGSTWTTIDQTTSNQYYDMPANTLPTSGTIMWRVATKEGADTTGYTTTSFTVGTPAQVAPVPIKPIGEYLDSTKITRFEWNFMGGTPGETQSKFDLQYSINGGSTWVTKTEITSNNFYELPVNTFNTGNVLWRVRTYNNYSEVSPYSENRSFYVIGSPPLPQITNIENKARPIITWTSQGQHLYELQIVKGTNIIIDTGTIPNVTDRHYKINDYLDDGSYKAKLRVMNEYGLYSPWAESNFVIETVKPNKPSLDVFDGEYGVELMSSDTESSLLVYRDGKYIGVMKFGYFEDLTGNNKKEHQYFIRVVDGNDNFKDSDTIIGRCSFTGNALALVSSPKDFIKLKLGLNDNPRKTNQFNISASLQNYDGRKYPVVEYGEFSNKSKTVSFYVSTKEDINRLEEMIDKREIFLYRNRDGSNIYGTILGIDYDENETFLGYEIGFSITQTDYKGAAYD